MSICIRFWYQNLNISHLFAISARHMGNIGIVSVVLGHIGISIARYFKP